jgi:hypothetical protein
MSAISYDDAPTGVSLFTITLHTDSIVELVCPLITCGFGLRMIKQHTDFCLSTALRYDRRKEERGGEYEILETAISDEAIRTQTRQ